MIPHPQQLELILQLMKSTPGAIPERCAGAFGDASHSFHASYHLFPRIALIEIYERRMRRYSEGSAARNALKAFAQELIAAEEDNVRAHSLTMSHAHFLIVTDDKIEKLIALLSFEARFNEARREYDLG